MLLGIEDVAAGDIFLTVRSNVYVIDREHLERMKHGILITNSDHFKVELKLVSLDAQASCG